MQEETRTLLITLKNGDEIQIDIPTSWKVTYGYVQTGFTSKDGRTVPMALRIYETDKHQRAIFTDVASFRDMSIPIRVKKVSVQEKAGFMECEGVRKRTIFQASTVNWVNPDSNEPEDNPLEIGMPKDSEMFGGKEEE